MDLDVNFKENVNVHMDIINTNPSENAVNVNRSDPEPEYKYEDGENILRKDDTMDRRFDLGLKLSSHEKRNLTSTPSKKNSNGASTCGGGGKYLENAFAQHRFGKDIHDLTHSRNQAFSPHALVSFHTYNRTSPKSATNNIKKEKKMELFTLVCGIKPQEGLYAGFECSFEMNITHGYPFHPPSVNCRTLGIYHPNINPSTGEVALALLSKNWSPVLTLRTVVLGLVLLFVEPNLDPVYILNASCALAFQNDPKEFVNTVRENMSDCLKETSTENVNVNVNVNVDMNTGSDFDEGAVLRPKRTAEVAEMVFHGQRMEKKLHRTPNAIEKRKHHLVQVGTDSPKVNTLLQKLTLSSASSAKRRRFQRHLL